MVYNEKWIWKIFVTGPHQSCWASKALQKPSSTAKLGPFLWRIPKHGQTKSFLGFLLADTRPLVNMAAWNVSNAS